MVMIDIVDHRRDGSAFTKENGFTGNNSNIPKKTTEVWEVLIEYKYETRTWVDIKDVKEARIIELADYAVKNQIADEPEFYCWVSYTLKKRNIIIFKVIKKNRRTTHKYGVRLPNNVMKVMQIDKKNGKTYYKEAIDKEIKKANITYKPIEGCTQEEVRKWNVDDMYGYQEIKCHVIFEMNMYFTWKARLVANGSKTEAPVSLTYSRVVSRESVRLVFWITALNDLDVTAYDIGNAYINAPCKEKIWFKSCEECGDHQGKVMILVQALYGIKTLGASCQSMFKEFIEMNRHFKSSQIDPNLLIRRNRRGNGTDYYELLLAYVDDVLAKIQSPESKMKDIGLAFDIKDNKYGPPTAYFGADVQPLQMSDGKYEWTIKCVSYVVVAVQTIKFFLSEDNRDLKSGKRPQKGPLSHVYKPDMDVKDEFDAEHMSWFQQLIGIFR